MANILLSHETLGSVWSPKYLTYLSRLEDRPGEKARSITGSTIHQVTYSDDASREIAGTVSVSRTGKSTLMSLFEDRTNYIIHFQDGEYVYKGYLKSLVYVSSPSTTQERYSFVFYVTEKLK